MYIVTAVVAGLAWLSLSINLNAKEEKKALYLQQSTTNNPDGCFTLSRGPDVNVEAADKGLHKFLQDLKEDFDKNRWQNLKSYFHDQLKVKNSIGDQIDAILMNRYYKPWQFSIYRVWELNDKAKDKKIYPCPNTEFEKIISRFGYASQYFVIIQIMGKNELGRLLISIAPNKDQVLTIIGLHIQQWTHQGMDWQKWSAQGNKFLESKDLKSAYVAYSVAEKMLDGGEFILYQYREEIEAEKKKIFDDSSFLSNIRNDAGNSRIVYAGTLLHLEGTGIFVRIEIDKEENAETLIKKCSDIGRALLNKGWLNNDKGGVKCNYIPKGTDPQKDSLIGGYYISQADFAK